jgi:hypothetical protein
MMSATREATPTSSRVPAPSAREFGSWPESLCAFVGLELIATGACALALLWWLVFGPGSLAMLAPAVLMWLDGLGSWGLLRAPFRQRPIVAGARSGGQSLLRKGDRTTLEPSLELARRLRLTGYVREPLPGSARLA